MNRPLIPPRGYYISTAILFHASMPPQVKDTLLQLSALTWGSPAHCTPPLNYQMLSTLTGKTHRTLAGHLSMLRNKYAALRLQSTGDGFFIIILADWTIPVAKDLPKADGKKARRKKGTAAPGNAVDPAAPQESEKKGKSRSGGKILHLPVKEEEDSIPLKSDSELKILLKNKGLQNFAQTAPVELAQDVQDALLEAGIFPSLLPEVAASGYKREDLLALLAWCDEDQPENPAPLLIARLRSGGRAPLRFFEPACPRCGLRGKHAANCPYRYLPEEYWENNSQNSEDQDFDMEPGFDEDGEFEE